mgnify:CR=1 FL=1|tara:strand:+ start:61 stop:480 length:420 start_codon:yes stop_codon:yes gene_type:complete
MKITENQLSNLKKYTSVLLSDSSKVVTLLSVSGKNNGWDTSGTANIEIMWSGNIEQDEYSISSILGSVKDFKFNNRDLDVEYNQFLLNLQIEVSRCNQDLVNLKTPNLFKCYATKTKSFIATCKRDNKRTIKYIKNLLK